MEGHLEGYWNCVNQNRVIIAKELKVLVQINYTYFYLSSIKKMQTNSWEDHVKMKDKTGLLSWQSFIWVNMSSLNEILFQPVSLKLGDGFETEAHIWFLPVDEFKVSSISF